MGLSSRLRAFEKNNGSACIAIVGAGYVGCGVLHTLRTTPAMSPRILVNRNVSKATDALKSAGVDDADIVVVDDATSMSEAMAANRFVVTDNHELLANAPVDIVIEATGAIDYGTKVILSALKSGQHVVSFNAEVDSLLAWLFHREARSNNVVYTIADGDQPGALLRLAEQVEAMGFNINAMLNCKRHMNLHQNPSSGAGFSARDTTSALMTTAFGDGTKMQVEQAVVANVAGMPPVTRGMRGIETTVETLIEDTTSLWSDTSTLQTETSSAGYIDYTLGGDFGAGVGVIASHPEGQHHSKAMALYKMGPGPNYFFFRPYHLVHLELPLTIADILFFKEALGTVDEPHVATVVAVAKKDLARGDALDGIGGYCVYGLVDAYKNASQLLPIALAQYATMNSDVAQDQPLSLNDVVLDESVSVVQIWKAMVKEWESCS